MHSQTARSCWPRAAQPPPPRQDTAWADTSANPTCSASETVLENRVFQVIFLLNPFDDLPRRLLFEDRLQIRVRTHPIPVPERTIEDPLRALRGSRTTQAALAS